MKHKLVVFNDRTVPTQVSVQHEGKLAQGVGHVKPGSCIIVELETSDGMMPYIKIWESGGILVSYIPESWKP